LHVQQFNNKITILYFQACADRNLEIAEIQSQEDNDAAEQLILLQVLPR
jgi:hypothetical protein